MSNVPRPTLAEMRAERLAEHQRRPVTRVTVFDAHAALAYYADHSDILIALYRVINDDVERQGNGFHVPGVSVTKVDVS